MSLEPRDFAAFFRAIYDDEPFPWQTRLVHAIDADGAWPDALALPTGSGKTSALDIAVFSLALDAARGRYRSPRRIVFLVDRRIIVDSAYARARQLRQALDTSDDAVVRRVRQQLMALSGDHEALHVARLRGGVPREGDWTPSPAHPTIVTSTVDQVGSRLLFRGYGVSESMRPVHAGLLGEDALLLLDEVHLSEPFRQTLEAIRHWRRAESSPWSVVQLSATPRSASSAVFKLDERDLENEKLARRIAAAKPARLDLVRSDGLEAHAAVFAKHALDLSAIRGGAARTVLVVVNRVDLARRVYRMLHGAAAEAGARALLLIGRARDIDKERTIAAVLERTRSGAASEDANPFFLVATQTVEAGADLDFDALVTQIAPLDALRQRFGRLNRLGRPISAASVIVARADEVGKRADPDPVYGDRLRPTWDWLTAGAADDVVDFGTASMERRLETPGCDRSALHSPSSDAPVLLPAHLDLWSQTRPTPSVDPFIPLFLHGPSDAGGEVQVVWRADVPKPAHKREEDRENVAALLELLPPRVGEAIPLPIGAVRRWMRGDSRRAADVDDTEGAVQSSDEARRESDTTIRGWRWLSADDDVEPIDGATVRPGDTLVVPASAGGCDVFGWAPEENTEVSDVADPAARSFRERLYSVRLHPAVIQQQLRGDRARADESVMDDAIAADAARLWRRMTEVIRAYGSERSPERLAEFVAELLLLEVPEPLREDLNIAAAALENKRPATIVYAYGDGRGSDDGPSAGIVLYFPRGTGVAGHVAAPALESATEDDDRGSSAAWPLTLAAHSDDVKEVAATFASQLRLPQTVAADVALAGWLHDLGKGDARFQRYLSGSRWEAWPEPVAKSARPRGRRAERRAREASGLPDRWRHEALSVRIAREHPKFSEAHDPELVLWLIGTHHGWGRPLFPHADSLDGVARRIDIGRGEIDLMPGHGPQSMGFSLAVSLPSGGIREICWVELFRRLRERYGYWGLARLEAVVRLADHRASERASNRSMGSTR